MGLWTLSYHVHGVQEFLIKTILDPDTTVRGFLDRLKEVTVLFGVAQIQTGADVLCIADHATGDLVGPWTYRDFPHPFDQRNAQGSPLTTIVPSGRQRWCRIFGKQAGVVIGLALLLLLSPLPPPPVELGPQRTVTTTNPKMGVHTRLTDEVEEWKIKRTLEMVREMGAPWVVEYFPWGYIEPAKGHFNWDHADVVVRHAVRQGLTLIARIDFVPPWARLEDTTFRYLDEDHFDDYGDFVYTFVARYRGQVAHVIVWNEPNLSFEWGYRPPDPEGYTRLLRVAYRRAKEANPDVQILAAGLAPTLAGGETEWGMGDVEFLQRMYEAGAGSVFDALAAHAYGWTSPADDPPAADKVNFRRVELLYQVMVRNGDGNKKVFITEGGWNDHPRWTRAVRPYQRIEYSLQAYEMARSWDWLDAVALWSFRLPWPTHTFQDYFTFVDVEFEPKPIYLDVQRYARAGG